MEKMQDKFIGKRLDGRYEIHELVGVGGMAYVYLAYDKLEDRWVAIKILKEEFSGNSDFLRRFRNESKAIALLSCENIVKIFDVSFGDKLQYIVMEYLDGITLKQYIEQQGTIRWQEAMHFMVQILTALECAHEKGIIHRDIKPQNIILMRDGTIKVTDFGIARFLQNETQTMTDTAIGSVHYISPEQAKGGYITDRADIYSTGVMLYEMLTGKLPFIADSAVSVALMQLQAKPVMPRELNPAIPIGLEQITMHAMEKNPANRFSNASEMLNDIGMFRQDPGKIFYYETADINPVPSAQRTNINEYQTMGQSQISYDDNYEYEEELVKSKKRRTGMMVFMGIIAALVVFLGVLGINYALKTINNMNNKDEGTVTVPDFINKNYENEILANALYGDFTFKIETINNPDKEAGIVINQSPNSGMTVKKGKEITLYVNKGEEKPIEIPDLTNNEQTEAINKLESLGLKTRIQTVPDDNIADGYVVKTDPSAGSTISPSSTVIIYVSSGKSERQVLIPDGIVGAQYEAASAAIENAGLFVGTKIMDDESELPENTVISVSPESGMKVVEGSRIDVVVSSGKGVPKTLEYTLTLPNEDVTAVVAVYRNGYLESRDNINLAMAGSIPLSYTGKSGKDRITVKIDDQTYFEADFDYDQNLPMVIGQYQYFPPQGPSDNVNNNSNDQGGQNTNNG